MEIYIILLIIKYILSMNCFDRCKECENESNNRNNQECSICNEGYYLTNSKNCYNLGELIGYFYNSTTYKYELCSENCYECIDNSLKCISCKRGYKYNDKENTCEQCNQEYYSFILDAEEKCQNNEKDISIISRCKLKYTYCSYNNTENYECPREYPLLVNGKKECSIEPYNSTDNNHIISNEIIKTQWLNKIIQIGEEQCWYIKADFSSNGDLIMETNKYDKINIDINRYFYGIKSNGRPLFYNYSNGKFEEQKTLKANTTNYKFESQIIKIKLENDDEKDYYLTCSFSDFSIEIIDFYNNKIEGTLGHIFFGVYDWSSKKFSILELKKEKKVYLFCFIALIEQKRYIILQKYKFFKPNISEEKSYERIMSTSLNYPEYAAAKSNTISCIEFPTLNIIQCFYINIDKYYVVSLFNEGSLELIQTNIIDKNPLNLKDDKDWGSFFQNIYLQENVSVLGYILDPESDLIYVQIKIIDKREMYYFENYFLLNEKIIINKEKKYSFNNFYYISELKTINENKFCLITTSKNKYEIYIIVFDFYAFHNTCLIIRHYHIPLRLYNLREFQYILIVNFNQFLGLVYTSQKSAFYPAIQYFSLFSYINSRDSDLITLQENTILQLKDYINEENIENNIFGVFLYGIKIIKLPKNIGIYYYSQKKNNIICENDILDPDDIINFVYDYENLKHGDSIYTIEIAGVVYEPEYSDFNKYPEYIEYYGKKTQESFYKQNFFVGKTGYYNFSISSNLTGTNKNSCKNNCKVCYNTFCVKCLNNYYLKEDENTCINKEEIKGYYFDENNNIYRKCHEYCITCSNGPIYYNNIFELKDTNCDICIENYYKVINTNNCFKKDEPPIAYYFDINKALFLNCDKACMTSVEAKKTSIILNVYHVIIIPYYMKNQMLV